MGTCPQKGKGPARSRLLSSQAHQTDFQVKIHVLDLSSEAHITLQDKDYLGQVLEKDFLRTWSHPLQRTNEDVIRIMT